VGYNPPLFQSLLMHFVVIRRVALVIDRKAIFNLVSRNLIDRFF
jgi:hypothetical protein